MKKMTVNWTEVLNADSVLRFDDGVVLSGANEIGEFIMNCCKSWHRGYMEGLVISSLKTAGLTTGAILAIYLIVKDLERTKKTQKTTYAKYK